LRFEEKPVICLLQLNPRLLLLLLLVELLLLPFGGCVSGSRFGGAVHFLLQLLLCLLRCCLASHCTMRSLCREAGICYCCCCCWSWAAVAAARERLLLPLLGMPRGTFHQRLWRSSNGFSSSL